MATLFTTIHPQAGAFAATGTGLAREVTGYDIPVGVAISGVFVGTVLVEVSFDGTNWAQFGSSLTAPGTVKIDIPVKQVRARCTAYTSGTIDCRLGATNSTHYDEQ